MKSPVIDGEWIVYGTVDDSKLLSIIFLHIGHMYGGTLYFVTPQQCAKVALTASPSDNFALQVAY